MLIASPPGPAGAPWRALPHAAGVGLVETVIALAILSILIATAAPAFSTWIHNTQIRTAAESIQAGLQQARAEAVQRNMQVQFSLMNSVDNNCDQTTTDSNWVVSLDDPSGACATAPASALTDPAPRIIAVRDKNTGSPSVVVLADQPTFIFNGLGRTTNTTTVSVCVGTSTASSACNAPAPERQLKVVVSPGGQIRMCNPGLASTDPQGC